MTTQPLRLRDRPGHLSVQQSTGEATVEIVKHRYGPTATIPVGVLDHYCGFANLPT